MTQDGPFRMPVQWVNRPNLDFRGFSGEIVGGTVHVGDPVRVLPSGRESTVERIVTFDGDLEEAAAGESVTLTLADEVDISRGDVLASAAAPPSVADQFEAHIVWMSDEPMLPGRPYLFKLGTRTVQATVAQPKYKVNVNTLEHTAAKTLELNEIGVANLSLSRPIAFDPYTENRDMGGFILIDRITNNTVGAGLLHFALRRSENVHWQSVEVDQAARAEMKHQTPSVLWFTGLSGCRQVDDRQHRGAQAARAGPAHVPARRRQPAPRPQQGPRLHRRRPRRERAAHGGGRGPDG